MANWLTTYREKLSRRSSRVNGFTFRFLFPRYLKSLLLLPSLIGLLGILFLRKNTTILYRPEARHLHLLQGLSKVLVIGTLSDSYWAREHGYDFFHFSPIYTSCNFGLSAWRLLLSTTSAKRVLIWTDFGLDQYLAIQVQSLNAKIWCVQHGLFPSKNNRDLDGMNAHINVVASVFQRNIMLEAGYKGRVLINNHLFQKEKKTAIVDPHSIWINAGQRIVFVGAGYNHDPNAEANIFNLIITLKKSLPVNYTLIYRPHPRDNSILKKLSLNSIHISRNFDSTYENDVNLVFIGIKSTYLLEAQNYGKLACLITGAKFPRYFEPGEIAFEVMDYQLDTLEYRINAYLIKNQN